MSDDCIVESTSYYSLGRLLNLLVQLHVTFADSFNLGDFAKIQLYAIRNHTAA